MPAATAAAEEPPTNDPAQSSAEVGFAVFAVNNLLHCLWKVETQLWRLHPGLYQMCWQAGVDKTAQAASS